MRQLNTISKTILSFFILTFIVFIVIFIYNSRGYLSLNLGAMSFQNMNVYVLTSVLMYMNFLPYILSLCVYYIFSNYSSDNTKSISSVLVFPVSFIIFIVFFYAIFNIFLYSNFSNALLEYNRGKDYKNYIVYQNNIKNETYRNIENALANNNYEVAYKEVYSLLYYEPYNQDTVDLIKKIEESKNSNITIDEQSINDKIKNNLESGIKYFSSENYKLASTYFSNVLELDASHELALYYLNRISILETGIRLYNIETTSSIEIHDKLSSAISLYQSRNYLDAYETILELYLEYPKKTEVKNYYTLITDAIRENNFFIDDAKRIENVYIDNKVMKNGFDIMLNQNVFLSVGDSVYFRDEYYLFDIILTDYDKSTESSRSVFYKYGKMNDIGDNKKEIILKGLYNLNTKIYDMNDRNFIDKIFIDVKNSSIEILRYKSSDYLKDKSVIDIINWKNDINKIGYSDNIADNYFLHKLLIPLYLLLFLTIVSYYSLRYRKILTPNFHFFHKAFGLLGIILLTFISMILFNLLIEIAMHFADVYLAALILSISFVILILVYMMQLSRININAN